MLLVKTLILHSPIHDVGVFADQDIPKWTVIWKFTKGFDTVLSKTKFESWIQTDWEQAFNSTYLDKNTNQYILCADSARFMNHSKTPNSVHMYSKNKYGQTIALRDIKSGEEITYHYQDCDRTVVPGGIKDMDSPKVIVGKCKLGQGVFAKEPIKKDEVITKFNGQIIRAKSIWKIPNDKPFKQRDHALPTDKYKYRESRGIARFINHSCSPNCGIRNKFFIVAMKDIRKGEEVTFDYDMVGDDEWTMNCKCRSKNCRKIIQGYSFLPGKVKKKYHGYISEYLVKNS